MRRENFHKAIHQKANAGQRYMRIPFPSGDGGRRSGGGEGLSLLFQSVSSFQKLTMKMNLFYKKINKRKTHFQTKGFA